MTLSLWVQQLLVQLQALASGIATHSQFLCCHTSGTQKRAQCTDKNPYEESWCPPCVLIRWTCMQAYRCSHRIPGTCAQHRRIPCQCVPHHPMHLCSDSAPGGEGFVKPSVILSTNRTRPDGCAPSLGSSADPGSNLCVSVSSSYGEPA
jgi:hypothetical protein